MITINYDRRYYSTHRDRWDWLYTYLGAGGILWKGGEVMGYWYYEFLNESDARLFHLMFPGGKLKIHVKE